MDPASRNRVLMVGGALIVVALLLVCGPGDGLNNKSDVPSVASAPPVVPEVPAAPSADSILAAEEAALGALAGATIGESDLGQPEEAALPEQVASAPPAPVVVPPAPVAPSTAKETAAKPPRVAAQGPVTPPAPPVVLPTPVELAEKAAGDFDKSLAQNSNGPGPNLVARFAPPVDSGPSVSPVVSAAQGFNSFSLRPCDSPGSGCQSVIAPRAAVIPPFDGAGGR